MIQTTLRFAFTVTVLAAAVERTSAIPAQQPDQILRSSDSPEFGQYGHSIALHGDRMIVGSIGASGASEYAGAAYILERSPTSGEFVEVKKSGMSSPASTNLAGGSPFMAMSLLRSRHSIRRRRSLSLAPVRSSSTNETA